MGRSITITTEEGSVVVNQPKISEIVDMGEDAYSKVCLPFLMTTEAIFGGMENEEELIEEFNIFDLFFVEVKDGIGLLDNIFGGNSLDILTLALSYFLDTDNIKILRNRQKIIVDDSYLIDSDEFENLRKVIQDIVGREDVEIEKPPKNMSKRQKDIWNKLQKGRKRKAEKEALYLQDMINYTAFGGEAYIPLDHIDNMTYYQFQNAYKSVMGKDAFKMGMSYKLSQKFEVKDEIKHWSDSLKIGK